MPLPPKVKETQYFILGLEIDKIEHQRSSVFFGYPDNLDNPLLTKIVQRINAYYTVEDGAIKDFLNLHCRIDVYLSIVIDLLEIEEVVDSIEKKINQFGGIFDQELLPKYRKCLEEMRKAIAVDKSYYLNHELFNSTIDFHLTKLIQAGIKEDKSTLDLRFRIPLD